MCIIEEDTTTLPYLHKMANKKYTWHLIIWVIYVVYQLIDYYEAGVDEFMLLALCLSYMAAAISTFYIFYGFVWKRFINLKPSALLLFPIGLGLLAFIVIRYALEEIVFEAAFGFGNYTDDSFFPYAWDNLWRAIFYAACGLIVFLLERRQTMKAAMMQLKNEKTEAEMAFLRSQLNPHFLFNTLSFLHTKTMKLDPELSDTILKLSDMLRYSMQNSAEEQVPVRGEIQLLENYISIFRNRFEGKFFVNFNKQLPGFPHKIEPLLLMPFVENMFKHGVMNDVNTPGEILLTYNGRVMIFNCRNKINTYEKDARKGIGLDNVRRRLELCYPNNHELMINEENGYFSSSLTLNV